MIATSFLLTLITSMVWMHVRKSQTSRDCIPKYTSHRRHLDRAFEDFIRQATLPHMIRYAMQLLRVTTLHLGQFNSHIKTIECHHRSLESFYICYQTPDRPRC